MRRTIRRLAALTIVAAWACGGGDDGQPEGAPAPEAAGATGAAVSLACQPMLEQQALEGRVSPYDSTRVTVEGESLVVCYGRPSSRGRTMIGGENVPYGELWRTGANEPTTLHVPFPAEIAGIAVEPGSYTLYTIPDPASWTVIVNRSIDQWGEESGYTEAVRAQEVGRASVPAAATAGHVETFTITSEPGEGGATNIVLEWEGSRIEIPVVRRRTA
jgi:hypothetical protein